MTMVQSTAAYRPESRRLENYMKLLIRTIVSFEDTLCTNHKSTSEMPCVREDKLHNKVRKAAARKEMKKKLLPSESRNENAQTEDHVNENSDDGIGTAAFVVVHVWYVWILRMKGLSCSICRLTRIVLVMAGPIELRQMA